MSAIIRPLPVDLVMEHGPHEPDGAMCLLEMTAWMAGEPWSYQPECACPILAAYGVTLWDRWPIHDLARLAPYAERLIATRSTPDVELRRAYRATDWAVRQFAASALLSAGLETEARTLQELSPIVDQQTARAARAARAAAEAAAAARAAAWAAAAEAAAAAGAAAWAAAEAAEAAAEAAAVWNLALLCFDDLLLITEAS